jgi:hypothetical protein
MSVLVPPMSMVSREGSSSIRPSSAAAVMPAAGPESSVWIGMRAASAAPITPPFDLVTSSRAAGSVFAR